MATAPVNPSIQPDALFRAAADQAPQVMWIVNTKGAVTYLNQHWYNLVGGERPKWYGHEWGDVVDPADLAVMRERWVQASATGSIFQGTRRVHAQDGSVHVLSYKATPIRDESGHVQGWVGMDADITEITAADEALRFANQELEAFSFSVSHDLRAPMATVHGFAHLLTLHLAKSGADEKAKHYLARILAGTTDMDRLIEGLLVLSQVARSKLKIEEVDITALAHRVLERHVKGSVALCCEVQPGMKVRADGRLMAVLLENLIGNAVKFSGRMASPQIDVRMESETDLEKVFVVQDNGSGFDMAQADRLFVAFQRLHAADDFPGTGIGLATVQRIVSRHGGRAWAKSEPGKGANMFFALPKR